MTVIPNPFGYAPRFARNDEASQGKQGRLRSGIQVLYFLDSCGLCSEAFRERVKQESNYLVSKMLTSEKFFSSEFFQSV